MVQGHSGDEEAGCSKKKQKAGGEEQQEQVNKAAPIVATSSAGSGAGPFFISDVWCGGDKWDDLGDAKSALKKLHQ